MAGFAGGAAKSAATPLFGFGRSFLDGLTSLSPHVDSQKQGGRASRSARGYAPHRVVRPPLPFPAAAQRAGAREASTSLAARSPCSLLAAPPVLGSLARSCAISRAEARKIVLQQCAHLACIFVHHFVL